MGWKNSKTYKDVKSIVDDVRIIDTHEHLPPEEIRLVESDALKRIFPVSRMRSGAPNGTVKALKIAAKDLYGFNLVSDKVLEVLNQKVLEKNRKGFYQWVLGTMGGIDLALTIDWPADRLEDAKGSMLAPVLDMDFYILLHNRASLDVLSNRCEIPIHTLSDLSAALDVEMEKHASSIVAFKTVAAYTRTLKFDKVDSAEAERVFNRISSSRIRANFSQPYLPPQSGYEPLSYKEAKPLQDYLMHRIIMFSIHNKLPLCFHTGWPGMVGFDTNLIGNFNPVKLTNLFLEYPDAKFVCIHGGYPYSRELGALSSIYRNVFIEMSWLHLVSPAAARSALSEWLECVPISQILAFGGDSSNVEGSYGASVVARENVARVLAEKVEDDLYTLEEAKLVAWKILRENAMELFHLSNRLH